MAWLKPDPATQSAEDQLRNPHAPSPEHDRDHLLAEHRAATAELRRLRTENAAFKITLEELEKECDLHLERIDELEALLAEAVAR